MRTTDEIYGEMKSAYEQRTGLALSDDGDMAIRLYATAAQIFALEMQANYVNRQAFPQLADGEYLDYHAQMRGLERTDAVKAEGTITFSISDAIDEDLMIAAGITCATAAGVEFITTEAGTIEAGDTSCTVAAEAVETGISGNVPADSITVMVTAPVGVSYCTNEEAFSGGCDTESDTSLRQRIVESYRQIPNGTNKAYYESIVLNTDGVEAVKVMPKERGVGTVDIIFTTAAGVPTEDQIASVQTIIDEQREISVDVDVAAPQTVTVNVAAQIAISDGYTYSTVAEAAEEAVTGYFTGKILGKDVLRAKLGSILYSIDGVENYILSSPAADIAIEEDELAVLGTVTITEMA